MATATHDVGRKLDALPLGRFHYRLTGLIVGGLFVDQFDNYITGGVLGAAIKEGLSTMSMNALFISAGTAGMTIGSIAAGWIGDRYGRRFSFQLNLLIFGAVRVRRGRVADDGLAHRIPLPHGSRHGRGIRHRLYDVERVCAAEVARPLAGLDGGDLQRRGLYFQPVRFSDHSALRLALGVRDRRHRCADRLVPA